tara:strand:+ start:932 stop:1150 length:219 start_codon:yes stop_codon:yes gene_type:complete
MNESSLIDKLGGTCAVAAMFGVCPAAVSIWRKSGIPNARRQTLALMYPGKVPKSWLPQAPKTIARKTSKRGK